MIITGKRRNEKDMVNVFGVAVVSTPDPVRAPGTLLPCFLTISKLLTYIP